MPKNIESGSIEDDIPKYRTTKGDEGLIFAETSKSCRQDCESGKSGSFYGT